MVIISSEELNYFDCIYTFIQLFDESQFRLRLYHKLIEEHIAITCVKSPTKKRKLLMLFWLNIKLVSKLVHFF